MNIYSYTLWFYYRAVFLHSFRPSSFRNSLNAGISWRLSAKGNISVNCRDLKQQKDPRPLIWCQLFGGWTWWYLMVKNKRRRGGEALQAVSRWFSGGRSVTTAITVEHRLGVGPAGRADKQGRGGGGRRRVGWRWGRRKKREGASDEREDVRRGFTGSRDLLLEDILSREALVLLSYKVCFLWTGL